MSVIERVLEDTESGMRGWETRSFADIRGVHLRPMSCSTGPRWKGREREGNAAYFCGTHPLFVLAHGIQ